MFRVLSFSLGVRMSLSVEGAGHMPRRCAATLAVRLPLLFVFCLAKLESKLKNLAHGYEFLRRNKNNAVATRL